MKTLALTLILTALTVSIGFGQTQDQTNLHRYVTDRIGAQLGGYVDKTETIEKSIMSYIKPPSFYDFDLVRSSISRWARQYSDVRLLINWHKLDNDSYAAGYAIGEDQFAIYYLPKSKTIVIALFFD